MTEKEIWRRDGFSISTNKDYLDEEFIYNFLSREAYWSPGISRETVRKSIINSALCFGIYDGDPATGKALQVGFARVVSDLATVGYLADVFVDKKYRGRGLAEWLIQVITEHPELKGLRRFLLATKDAHTLYAKYGFKPLDDPGFFMQIVKKQE